MQKLLTAVLSILIALLPGITSGQTSFTGDSLDELERARALLYSQRERLEPMDARLLEPIEQLADQLMAQNQFDEAHDMLDRAMQITRLQDGLYTEQQRPLLKKKIDNYANRRDWESARESMEHLYWLYTEKSRYLDTNLVEDLLELAQVHLRGVAEDTSYMQAYHFNRSAQVRWLALGVAERLWGKTDERLVPIVYSQLRQLHLQTVALWRGGATSYNLRKVAPGSEIMRDRDEANELFYLTGLGLINNLYMIYAESEAPDAEAMAMTNLYLADWHILYGHPRAATETYQQAHQQLLSAGIDAERVNDLFGQPMVIPDTEFYASVEGAIASQESKLLTDGEEASHPYLSFSEWTSALPNVRNPISRHAPPPEDLDSNFAMFSFSLAGVNKVSRWYSHRFVSTVNMIEQAELLANYSQTPPAQEVEILAKLNSLTFRPKIVDGEPQQATGHLKYHFAEGSL